MRLELRFIVPLVTAIICAGTGPPSPTSAQEAASPAAADTVVETRPGIEPGAHVRIERVGHTGWLPGRFVGIDTRGVQLAPGATPSDTLRFPLPDVVGLELATGRRDTSRGFWIGFGAGAALSLVGGVAASTAGGSDSGANMGAAGGVLLALPLGLLGGVIGSGMAPEEWLDVTIVRRP